MLRRENMKTLCVCSCRWTLGLLRRWVWVRRRGHFVELLSTLLLRSSWTKVTTAQLTAGLWEYWSLSCWVAGTPGLLYRIIICVVQTLGGYCWTNVSTSCLQPSIFRLRSNDDLQHHPERDRHDRVPQEDHQERRNPHQKTLQVIQRTYLKCNMRMPFFQNRSCVGVFQGQSFREAGKPEKRSEGYSETQVRATHHT